MAANLISEDKKLIKINTRLEGELTPRELADKLNEWFIRKVDKDAEYNELDVHQYLYFGALPMNLGGNPLVKRVTEKNRVFITIGEPVWEPFRLM